jgi:hypothetical protein
MPAPVDVATSKVQILEAPRLLPGTCMLCGTSRTDDRQYIDIGKDIQFVGVIYFCTFCMTEIANRLGCLMPEQTKALEDELDAARQRILEFETKDETLNAAINTLRDTGLFSGTDLTSFQRGIPTAMVEDSQPSLYDSILAEQRTPSINQDTEQSDSEQGSDDVSTARNDELKFDFGL